MKKIYILFLLFVTNISFGEDKLTGYKCSNAEDTYVCNQSCKIDGFLAEYQVNAQKNLVLKTAFRKSNPKTPMLKPYYLDNCKVLDKNNWECLNSYGQVKEEIISYKGIVSSIFSAPGITNYNCYK